MHSEATNAEEKQSAPETAGLVTREEKKETPGPRPYVFPPLSCLKKGSGIPADMSRELKETAMRLQQTLSTFGVGVTITDISQGPTVTRYELQPEQGVKVSKIVNLADDIKLNLAATDIRIEAPIPGKAAIGIEVPNQGVPCLSALRDLLESREFREFPSNIAFAVGKDIAGKVVVSDIAKMPHMLIAGATGSGKSVCINTLIMSILYKAHPDDVKLIMVDPKVVELSVYNGIPHLLIPVVTDPKKASAALQWGVSEMTDRYQKFADFNVRDLKGYNKKAEEMGKAGKEDAPAKLPQIVIIVDELADLMMVSPGEVEASICRLAQLAKSSRHPPDHCHPTSKCGRHHRTDQGKHAKPCGLFRIQRHGFQDHSGYEWCGKAFGKGRYALLSSGLFQACPYTGRLCLRRRGCGCCGVFEKSTAWKFVCRGCGKPDQKPGRCFFGRSFLLRWRFKG